jgi:hypothetical protein
MELAIVPPSTLWNDAHNCVRPHLMLCLWHFACVVKYFECAASRGLQRNRPGGRADIAKSSLRAFAGTLTIYFRSYVAD